MTILHSAGLKRGAYLPADRQKLKDHTQAVRALMEAFQAHSSANQAMDFDIVELEAERMKAAGIPPELLPPRVASSSFDGGNPFPAGRQV